MKTAEYYIKPGYVAISVPQPHQITNVYSDAYQEEQLLVEFPVVIDGSCNGIPLYAGTHKVVIRRDNLVQLWAKQKMVLDGINFVLCPEKLIIAIKTII